MTIIKNRKAEFDYFIEDTYEAGIMLEGWEVKAIIAGRSNLQEAYVVFSDNEFKLVGAHISPLPTTSVWDHPFPTRTRTLLLHKNEISKLAAKVKISGYTIVPVDMHITNRKIKLKIGLAKGKKMHDKRKSEKDKDAKREVDIAMKRQS
jgi:SsrA-binding protein